MSEDANWTDESFKATDKGKLVVLFHPVQVENKFKSNLQNRPVFEEQIFITKIVPGDSKLVIDRKLRDSDKDEFPEAWARWERTKSNRIPGMPIESWHSISDTQKAEFKALQIHTVEQFANLPDSAADKIMGFHDLHSKARVFIEAGKDAELMGKIRKETDDKIAQQGVEIDKLRADLKLALDALQRPVARRRGRKPKARLEQEVA